MEAKGDHSGRSEDPYMAILAGFGVSAQLRDLTALLQEITQDTCVNNQ